MIKRVVKLFSLLVLVASLAACASSATNAILDQGHADFENHNYKAAYQRLYPLAEQGNSDAQYAVGYILYTGKAGVTDQAQGLEWIRKSAMQGNPTAVKAWNLIEKQTNVAPTVSVTTHAPR